MLQWEILPNSFWKQGSNIYHHHLPQLSMLKAEQRKKKQTALEQLNVWGGCFGLLLITKAGKQSEGTGCTHHTRPCPTAKINTLLQKEETVPTYWADILEISKIIFPTAEPESHTPYKQHCPKLVPLQHNVAPPWPGTTVWYIQDIPAPGEDSSSCSFLNQKLMNKGPHCFLRQPRVRSQNEDRSEPAWNQNGARGSNQPLPKATGKGVGATALHLQLFWAISFRKTLINKVHYSFRITVQLVLNLPVTKEILHLRKHRSINLTTEQTIPSRCYACWPLIYSYIFVRFLFFFLPSLFKLRCLYPDR